MLEMKNLDYIKLTPLLPTFLKMVSSLSTEEERTRMLVALIREAKSLTTAELVGAQRQLQEATASTITEPMSIDSESMNGVKSGDEATDIADLLQQGTPELSLQKINIFLTKHKVSESLIRRLFIENNGKPERIYSTLKTTLKSEAQRRVMLLQCLASAISTGNFSVEIETVKQECKDFGVLDTNFMTNLKRNVKLFKNDDMKVRIELNEAGQKELAEVIGSVASED